MHVLVNGESREIPAGMSIDGLLAVLGLTGKRIAVEINEEIVPRSQHGATVLADGDRIEIVHAIGGG